MKRGACAQVQTKMVEFIGLPFSFSSKLNIWSLHVVVVQGRQQNLEKKKAWCTSRLVVLLIKPIAFLTFPLRHRRGFVMSLILRTAGRSQSISRVTSRRLFWCTKAMKWRTYMCSKIILYTKAKLFLIRESRNRHMSRGPCKYFFPLMWMTVLIIPNLLTYLLRPTSQASVYDKTFHRFFQAMLTESRYVVPFNVADRVICFLPLLTLPTLGCHKTSFEAISLAA